MLPLFPFSFSFSFSAFSFAFSTISAFLFVCSSAFCNEKGEILYGLKKNKYHWDATGRHTVFTMTLKVCHVILNPFTKSMAPAFTLWNAITKWTCPTFFTVVTPTKYCKNYDDLSLHLVIFKFMI